jgi:hypothetical protein
MVIGEKDSDIYISPQNALNEGLSRRTATRWYGIRKGKLNVTVNGRPIV